MIDAWGLSDEEKRYEGETTTEQFYARYRPEAETVRSSDNSGAIEGQAAADVEGCTERSARPGAVPCGEPLGEK